MHTCRQRQALELGLEFPSRWVLEFLAKHPCVDCGESEPALLEFDHLDRHAERADVGLLIQRGCSLGTVVAEIAKCVVRCTDCHGRRTATRLCRPTGRLTARPRAPDAMPAQVGLTQLP